MASEINRFVFFFLTFSQISYVFHLDHFPICQALLLHAYLRCVYDPNNDQVGQAGEKLQFSFYWWGQRQISEVTVINDRTEMKIFRLLLQYTQSTTHYNFQVSAELLLIVFLELRTPSFTTLPHTYPPTHCIICLSDSPWGDRTVFLISVYL